MIFNLAIAAALAFVSVADAQTRPTDGCASVMAETECVGYNGCKWFLGACTEKPLVNCWEHAKVRSKCNKTPGCRWFTDPAQYVPPESEVDVPMLQCRDHTACDIFPTPKSCNSKSWCSWVDGKCRTYGTEPSDDWFPRCWNVGTFKKTCKFQNPKCRWFNFDIAGENIVYGCRHVEFCDFHKGENAENQCRKNKYCVFENGKCKKNPTASPTASPSASPSASPTATPTVPTKSPTLKPTTRSPTLKPTTRSPTFRPTTGFPTSKPTTGFPTAA